MPVVYNRATGKAGGDKPDKPDKNAGKTPKQKPGKSSKGKADAADDQKKKIIILSVVTVLALAFIGWFIFGRGGAPETAPAPNMPRPGDTAPTGLGGNGVAGQAGGNPSNPVKRGGGFSTGDSPGGGNGLGKTPATDGGEGIN